MVRDLAVALSSVVRLAQHLAVLGRGGTARAPGGHGVLIAGLSGDMVTARPHKLTAAELIRARQT